MAIDREKVLASAQKYVEKKKYDRAVAEYQRIIQEDPTDARTLLKLGDLLSKMGSFADAVATYERVGKFYASQGFSLKAIAVYKQIREIIARHVPQLEDKYSHVTPKLAALYQQLGLVSDALTTLDEVATRLQRQNRDLEAIEVFRKIVELDPTNPLPHLRLAEALARTKNVDSAVSEFATAAEQLLKLGRRDDGLKVLERLLHHKPDAAHARTAAEVYLSRGSANDGMQALAKLQICFQANPRDLDTLTCLAKAFTQIGQAAKAIEVQKEMARIARDAGKADLFRELVDKLVKIAPNDEGVRQLAAASQAPRAPSNAPSESMPSATEVRPQEPPESVEDESESSYEDVGDGDFEPDEPAIELRRSAPTEPDAEVVVDGGVEAVEEVGAESSAADGGRIAKLLAEAALYRRARLFNKAIAVLRSGLDAAPKAFEIHEMLRDVLIEAGHTRDASRAMVRIAGLLVESLDGEAAARALQEALALDPENPEASDMLHELGYELVEEPTSSGSLPETVDEPSAATAHGSYDPEAPLPAYELDEPGTLDVGPAAAAPEEPEHTDVQREPVLDDPFADSPLPRFPLDGGPGATAEEQRTAPAPALRSPSGGAGAPELESALEEAEFFMSRGLLDDARTILHEQLDRLPNHPLLLERLAELEAHERSMLAGSGTRPSPAAGSDEPDEIAASLSALDQDRESGIGPGPGAGAPTEQVDVEEVFAKFKAGVAQQISVDDAQSHYDLGVAYKEMGLVDDATREFDLAARDPRRECVCRSMIGMIHLERGNLNEAIEAFQRGLQADERTREQEAALCYELGAAYETKRMLKPALEHFQRTARLTPGYRDVQERVRRLQKTEPKQPARAVAVGADDEFDRAFDDMLGSLKRP